MSTTVILIASALLLLVLMSRVVNASHTLEPGIRANFRETYQRMYLGSRARLEGGMDLTMTSDKLFEIYAYFESAPNMARWDRGAVIKARGFKSVKWSTYNLDWGIRVDWHENDEQDDQIDGLLKRAREAGQSAALLDERIFFQIIQAGTDLELLKSIPNAPDGAAIYSTTDGSGSDRFGVSNGNLLTGDASPTGADLRDSIFEALSQWSQMLDTEGEPLFDPGILDQGIIVYYQPALNQTVANAFQQAFPFQDNTAGDAAAAPSNVIIDAGVKLDLRQTVRVTTNDLYLFLKGATLKPVYKQTRSPLRPTGPTVMETSERMRDMKRREIQWDLRAGYGVALPYATIKINNS